MRMQTHLITFVVAATAALASLVAAADVVNSADAMALREFYADAMALREFYTATSGPQWSGTVVGWGTATNPCSGWTGVVCDAKSQRVVELSLPARGLQGKFPAVIGNLTQLQSLTLPGNHLRGPVSTAALSALESLAVLDLSNNPIEVTSAEVVNVFPTGLTTLRLVNCSLTGPLAAAAQSSSSTKSSSWPSHFAKLQELSFFGNGLSGSLPSAFSTWKSLRFLDLSGNRLSGGLPSSWGQGLSNLRTLKLSSNEFSGGLPDGWAAFASRADGLRLQQLDLSFNALTGSLPASWEGFFWQRGSDSPLSSAPVGTSINLAANMFSGPVPSEWVLGSSDTNPELKCMVNDLDLSGNRLTGALPQIVACPFGILSLAHNSITGELPNGVAATLLDIAGNEMSGSVPCGWSNPDGLNGGTMAGGLRATRFEIVADDNRGLALFRPAGNACPLPLNRVTRLVAGFCSTNVVPADAASELPSLETLGLRGNNARGKVPNITKWSKLRTVDLSLNLFDSVPPIRVAPGATPPHFLDATPIVQLGTDGGSLTPIVPATGELSATGAGPNALKVKDICPSSEPQCLMKTGPYRLQNTTTSLPVNTTEDKISCSMLCCGSVGLWLSTIKRRDAADVGLSSSDVKLEGTSLLRVTFPSGVAANGSRYPEQFAASPSVTSSMCAMQQTFVTDRVEAVLEVRLLVEPVNGDPVRRVAARTLVPSTIPDGAMLIDVADLFGPVMEYGETYAVQVIMGARDTVFPDSELRSPEKCGCPSTVTRVAVARPIRRLECPNKQNVAVQGTTKCVACPKYAACNGTVSTVPESGVRAWRAAPDTLPYFACGTTFGEGCGKTGSCNTGYTGARCASCSDGYGSAFGLECIACLSHSKNVAMVVVFSMIVVLVFALLQGVGIRFSHVPEVKPNPFLDYQAGMQMSRTSSVSTPKGGRELLVDMMQARSMEQSQSSSRWRFDSKSGSPPPRGGGGALPLLGSNGAAGSRSGSSALLLDPSKVKPPARRRDTTLTEDGEDDDTNRPLRAGLTAKMVLNHIAVMGLLYLLPEPRRMGSDIAKQFFRVQFILANPSPFDTSSAHCLFGWNAGHRMGAVFVSVLVVVIGVALVQTALQWKTAKLVPVRATVMGFHVFYSVLIISAAVLLRCGDTMASHDATQYLLGNRSDATVISRTQTLLMDPATVCDDTVQLYRKAAVGIIVIIGVLVPMLLPVWHRFVATRRNNEDASIAFCYLVGNMKDNFVGAYFWECVICWRKLLSVLIIVITYPDPSAPASDASIGTLLSLILVLLYMWAVEVVAPFNSGVYTTFERLSCGSAVITLATAHLSIQHGTSGDFGVAAFTILVQLLPLICIIGGGLRYTLDGKGLTSFFDGHSDPSSTPKYRRSRTSSVSLDAGPPSANQSSKFLQSFQDSINSWNTDPSETDTVDVSELSYDDDPTLSGSGPDLATHSSNHSTRGSSGASHLRAPRGYGSTSSRSGRTTDRGSRIRGDIGKPPIAASSSPGMVE